LRQDHGHAASPETIVAIAGHVSREMLQRYSHIRLEVRRKAVAALDNVAITSQLERWQTSVAPVRERQLHGKKEEGMVGAEDLNPRPSAPKTGQTTY